MKLRNKKTGEKIDGYIRENGDLQVAVFEKWHMCKLEQKSKWYDSLAQLNEEWEDYEEPKDRWFIDPIAFGYVDELKNYSYEEIENVKELGFDFDTKEEAEKAVEKLKAWKRLSENKYLFSRLISLVYSLNGNSREFDEYMDDILLLFGDE